MSDDGQIDQKELTKMISAIVFRIFSKRKKKFSLIFLF